MMLRRLAGVLALLLATGLAAARADATPRPKVLRYALNAAETGFDPAQISDLYSSIITANIFDAPLRYDPLARPAALRPNTARELPEVLDGGRRFILRLQPGIHFADDPAFGGRPRELTAEDYVYSIKRHFDPRWRSPSLYTLENLGILGLSELRARVLKAGTPFPYDEPVAGLQALDRYTLQIRTATPQPRLPYLLAAPSTTGAVAREVVERYGDDIMAHPVGTGAFRLVQWRRSSLIVLERNPRYREVRYDARPAPDDARGQAIARRLAGRRLPMIDRVEVSIIEESQPRWLAFLNGEHDLLERMPFEFADIAVPGGELAPHLAQRGIGMERTPSSDVTLTYFNMEHPVVGGYTPQKVALRRAIALALDVPREIRQVRRRQAVAAQSIVAPGTFGHDPALRTEMGQHDLARARALLDLYGYVDRDGDGWRDQPDGSPLVLSYATGADQQARQLSEIWHKSMTALGVRIEFQVAKWPEQLKRARAGALMMWGVGFTATEPDADTFLALAYGPNAGQANLARFSLPAYDALYRRQRELPDGPERLAAIGEAIRLLTAWMPYKAHTHRIATDMWHPQLVGFRRHPFMLDYWRYVDIDPDAAAPGRGP